jgi:hypothetical protein
MLLFAQFNDQELMKSPYNYVDDVTKLNETYVDQIFSVTNYKEVINVIKLAKEQNKKVIARGESHSMGGQSIVKDGFIIDTKQFNKVLSFDRVNATVTVEPGITWLRLIYFLNKYSYSPEILQSYASFSVGGSCSVNIHGITSDNTLSKSILELVIVNSKGEIVTCNRKINRELFSLVLGGYGLFGIIISVKLKIVNNTKLYMNSLNTNIQNFAPIYDSFINNKRINIKIARVNISNMEDINLYVFTKSNGLQPVVSPINEMPKEMSKMSQSIYKWMLPNQSVQKIRFNLETLIGKPLDFISNSTSRNEFLYETAKPLATLYSPFVDLNKTHILQEYFVPDDVEGNFIEWMNYLKEIFVNNNYKFKHVDLLNVTIRYVMKDTDTFLKYAPKNMYAFVFYYRIDKSEIGDWELKGIHELLVNKVLSLGGTFYLPYRLHYKYDQMETAYNSIGQFFELKKKYDKDEMFWNMWYEEYGRGKV